LVTGTLWVRRTLLTADDIWIEHLRCCGRSDGDRP
jgi:hypothetical protein